MAVRVSSTVSSTAGIVDHVASGITGWSPGHSDTSGTISCSGEGGRSTLSWVEYCEGDVIAGATPQTLYSEAVP